MLSLKLRGALTESHVLYPLITNNGNISNGGNINGTSTNTGNIRMSNNNNLNNNSSTSTARQTYGGSRTVRTG